MKIPNIEGLTTHDGPESCVGVRKGADEALTGVRASRAIEPRNHVNRAADAASSGRQHRYWRYRDLLVGPARSGNPCMYGVLLRENQKVSSSIAGVIAGRAAQGTLRR